MAKTKGIVSVNGIEIRLYQEKEEDFVSLTDIAKQSESEPRFVIRNWLTTKGTINYLEAWETLHNSNFNRAGLRTVKEKFFSNSFSLTPSFWIEHTNPVGVVSKSGRNGGTFAHKDIALNFCYWLSPVFQVYLIKEFQRLKIDEAERLNLDWNLKRTLSKINYTIHTDAIKEELIPPRITMGQGFIYAGEADILNVAVFGMTAKVWRKKNPNKKGNIRDFATAEQLLVLSNLEAVNAELIRIGMSQDERVDILNKAAIKQMISLVSSPSLPGLSESK